ncbi:hypothetical protein RJ639_003444 [Escallonia herrerae]|uniref:Secreted protein n=1 Tax=Escallonia herrerae TaxID=1293975 RepID=A0AA88W2C7_9ASTE|nr:hypothetical protein RJ639_003444 [Escallonia herrerae]
MPAWAMSMAIFYVAVGYECKNGHVHGHGWDYAHATFYGDMNGGETIRKLDLCPYLQELMDTKIIIRTRLWSSHNCVKHRAVQRWGNIVAYFHLMCVNDPKWCKPDTIRVAASNFCPPNYTEVHGA